MKNKSEVEHSLITKYRKDIWRKFMKAVRDYELVKDNDHIAVCISHIWGKRFCLTCQMSRRVTKAWQD